MQAQTRREFIAGACLFAGMIAIGGVSVAYADNGELLRPPGGQDEERLRSLCVKCDRCRTVCHAGCIEPASVSDSFIDARTPKLNFHYGYCDFCNKCIETCPTEALEPFDPETQTIGIAKVNTDECIAYTRGNCNVCEDSCEYGALNFESGHPVITGELCCGCGACVMACNININMTFNGSYDRAIEVYPAEVS
ncbi:MAG: 4Fe-4S dicluster domain-containing protein [Eggerthellaceae bacterium]|nr:4Fe-4S dicluster domain-containing protein [Eggerthellaceae bacterium]